MFSLTCPTACSTSWDDGQGFVANIGLSQQGMGVFEFFKHPGSDLFNQTFGLTRGERVCVVLAGLSQGLAAFHDAGAGLIA